MTRILDVFLTVNVVVFSQFRG